MRILLAVLMCLVLTSAQSFALKGGPNYGAGRIVTTGIYAGLFVPTTETNSLGIFTATIPKAGLGTGTVGLFRNGIFYPGTIQAIADPDSAKLTGVIDAEFTLTVRVETSETGGTTNLVHIYTANGSLDGRIQANRNLFSTATTRIKGLSYLTFSNSALDPAGTSVGPVEYTVNGFKQADSPN